MTRHEIHSSPLPLTPGTYRLTEDVTNPKPDRRSSQTRVTTWENWAVWPKGMEFIVDMDPLVKHSNRVYPHGGYHKAGGTDNRLTAIIIRLEPVNETPSQFLARYCSGSRSGGVALDILDKLNIPISELERVIAELESENED